MSATDVVAVLPRLSEADRQRALQLMAKIEALQDELQALLPRSGVLSPVVDLQARGIDENQAADLRSRLKTFAGDWERPEAAIYDEDPAR
jgi:hypothetical protein